MKIRNIAILIAVPFAAFILLAIISSVVEQRRSPNWLEQAVANSPENLLKAKQALADNRYIEARRFAAQIPPGAKEWKEAREILVTTQTFIPQPSVPPEPQRPLRGSEAAREAAQEVIRRPLGAGRSRSAGIVRQKLLSNDCTGHLVQPPYDSEIHQSQDRENDEVFGRPRSHF
jgi:hypothetical protein